MPAQADRVVKGLLDALRKGTSLLLLAGAAAQGDSRVKGLPDALRKGQSAAAPQDMHLHRLERSPMSRPPIDNPDMNETGIRAWGGQCHDLAQPLGCLIQPAAPSSHRNLLSTYASTLKQRK